MNIYFISEVSDNGNNAGSKARNDIENIFNKRGWKKINDKPIITQNYNRNLCYFVKSTINSIKIVIKILKLKNSTIFVQYPVLKGKVLNWILTIAAKRNKICFIVHDINALRVEKDKQTDLMSKEINLLNSASAVVLHNNNMIKYLKENGLKVKTIVNLSLFDYLVENEKESIRKFESIVVYAGNLDKGSFLDQLSADDSVDFTLNLYGPNFRQQMADNIRVRYKGNFPPDEVVYNLEGSFGLIWDGESPKTCVGIKGEYTRYNNPHKLSLYIAAGIPVIAWSESAIADFIVSNNIGFVVDSIYQIDSKLQSLNEIRYQEYIKNIDSLKKKVKCGYFSEHAIEAALCK